jgi:small-conductance mechanosensitive channel
VLEAPAPVYHFRDFGDSSLDLALFFRIGNPTDSVVNVRDKVLLALQDSFREHHIGIPFPDREMIFCNPLEVAKMQATKAQLNSDEDNKWPRTRSATKPTPKPSTT